MEENMEDMEGFLIECTAEELEEKIKSGEFDVNASFSRGTWEGPYDAPVYIEIEYNPVHMLLDTAFPSS